VEESAAAAESLKDQAHRLTEVVSVFRLGNDDAKHGGYAMAASSPKPAPKAAGAKPAASKPASPHPAAKPAAKPATTAAADGWSAKPAKPAAAPPAPAAAAAQDDAHGDWQSF